MRPEVAAESKQDPAGAGSSQSQTQGTEGDPCLTESIVRVGSELGSRELESMRYKMEVLASPKKANVAVVMGVG